MQKCKNLKNILESSKLKRGDALEDSAIIIENN